MVTALRVKCNATDAASGGVCLWDQDAAHYAVDPSLKDKWGGAYIFGDPAHPDAEHVIAATDAARAAVKLGRLVLVEEFDFQGAHDMPKAEPPSEVTPPVTPPAEPPEPPTKKK